MNIPLTVLIAYLVLLAGIRIGRHGQTAKYSGGAAFVQTAIILTLLYFAVEAHKC